ncbi:hypothetical protein [Pseudomonas sp. C9-3]|uniref:hypothetical protein n=1 Tax=Pseudomonas sp. C9-3 TaxID=3078264 RepID=UPI0028EB8950|nr:hypothetical protein [Pseudomonas sp. C9-3]
MAIVKCKECGGQVSTTAKACPTCGSKPPKKTSVVTWLVLATIVIVVAKGMLTEKPPEPTKTPDQIAADAAAEKQRAAEAKVRQEVFLTQAIAKEAVLAKLKDPDSAKFGQIISKASGIVCGYVNAKNAFGGYTGDKAFMYSPQKQIAVIQGEAKDFEGVWNKQCATN